VISRAAIAEREVIWVTQLFAGHAEPTHSRCATEARRSCTATKTRGKKESTMNGSRIEVLCTLAAAALVAGLPGSAAAQVCEDAERTFFAGGPGSEGCTTIEGRATCEIAWVEGRSGPASCGYREDIGCFGCGPANEDAGLCGNTCVAPPEDGDPIPCTIGFWTNRSHTPMGQSQHFPDPEFDQVVDYAATLTPLFADGADLLDALTKQGRRTQEEKARQQAAALALSLGAGDLYPDNGKCQLFEGNLLSENSCEGDTSVGEAFESIQVNIGNGDFELAKDCADDINNGIGVEGADLSN
jgi:hypothetical protein